MVAPRSRAFLTVATLMQRAAFGGEIVLIFDENHRSRFRIHRLSPSDFALSTGRVKRRRYVWTNSAPKTSASLSRPPPARPIPPNICQPAPVPANGLTIDALTMLDHQG